MNLLLKLLWDKFKHIFIPYGRSRCYDCGKLLIFRRFYYPNFDDQRYFNTLCHKCLKKRIEIKHFENDVGYYIGCFICRRPISDHEDVEIVESSSKPGWYGTVCYQCYDPANDDKLVT